jgi:hypothetical protein
MTASGPQRALAAWAPRGVAARARITLAVALLAAGTVVWAVVPVTTGRAGTRLLVILAVASAVLVVAQLIAAQIADGTDTVPRLDTDVFSSPLLRSIRHGVANTLALPWPQSLILAALALEALHPARPWHTAVLGVVLLVFLLTLHLGETGDRPAVLWPHVPLVVAGLGLAALSAGAAYLPTGGSGWLAAVAAIAALITAGLALPL